MNNAVGQSPVPVDIAAEVPEEDTEGARNLDLGAEILVLVTGLFPERPITKEQGEQAERTIRAWKRAVREFYEGERLAPFSLPERPAYETTLDALNEGMTIEEGKRLVMKLGGSDVADAYLMKLAEARATLKGICPVSYADTPRGPQLLEPAPYTVGDFWSCWDVFNDPARFLAELNMGTLMAIQADTFRKVFPQSFDVIATLLNVALFTKPKAYVLPYPKELTLRRMLGAPAGQSITATTPTVPGQMPSVQIDFDKAQTHSQKLDA